MPELLQLWLIANVHPRPQSRYQNEAQGKKSEFIPSVCHITAEVIGEPLDTHDSPEMGVPSPELISF
ncbi:hypothetical protein ACFX1W_046627 [Malus domestica]